MSVEKLIIPLVMNVNPHSVLSLWYFNDVHHWPLLTSVKRIAGEILVITTHWGLHCAVIA